MSWRRRRSTCSGSAARARSTTRRRRPCAPRRSCCTAPGVDYVVLGPEETCTGDPARRSGNEFVFQMLAAQNVEVLNTVFEGRAPGTRKIVTTCPHCFNTLGREYPAAGRPLRGRAPHPAAQHAGPRGPARPGRGARRRARGRHLPRPLLPGPAQRGLRRAARARRRIRRAPDGDAAARGPLVLLRRGRRAHVDGGEDRQAGQPGPRRRGAGHRRGEDRHGLPVLPGHAVGRPHPTPERGAGNRGRGPRRRPAPAGRGHARRPGPTAPARTAQSTRSAQAPRGWRPLPCPARRSTARGRRPRSARTPSTRTRRAERAPAAADAPRRAARRAGSGWVCAWTPSRSGAELSSA